MDFDQRLSLLRDRYQASLPSKRSALEAAWIALRNAPDDAAARSDLRTLLHRLAGSAPAYGHLALGEAAMIASTRVSGADDDGGDLASELAPSIKHVLNLLDKLVQAQTRAVDVPSGRGDTLLRILLIEDDDDQAAAIEAALAAQGCEIRRVAQAESPWEVITTWPCDAVVIDYWLGVETATGIVRLLREEPSFASIALICLTVETRPAALQDMLDHGCDRVLSKRETPQRIADVLRACIAERRTR